LWLVYFAAACLAAVFAFRALHFPYFPCAAVFPFL
jgi:hypothetical protein